MTFTNEHVDHRWDLRHGVLFYASEAELAEAVGSYVAEGLRRAESAVVVATPDHRMAIAGRLVAAGIDVEAAERTDHLVTCDAATTLGRVSLRGTPDPARFAAAMARLLPQTGRVRIFGEMVALLWQDGRVDDAIRLEAMWCQWLEAAAAQLLCAYPASALHEEAASSLHALHDVTIGPVRTNHPSRRQPSRPCAAQSFGADVTAIRGARRFVTESLRTLGGAAIADDVELAVTELAANAVLHAQTEFVVELALSEDRIELSVRDRGSVAPTMPDADSLDGSGRGLRIVAALADRWGVERQQDAKVVWAEFLLAARPSGSG
jgi:anti-sigma regulatory factor (Ser/Thr protein kinase)